MNEVLAYVPFLHPLGFVHQFWYVLIIPLAFGISMIYKALRMIEFDRYWREVVIMTLQIILGMVALAIALLVLVQFIIPALPVD